MSAQRANRTRSFLGRLSLLVFLLFNATMLVWLLLLWGAFGEDLETGNNIEHAGTIIDATATTSMVLLVWVAGAAITGLLVFLTRRPNR